MLHRCLTLALRSCTPLACSSPLNLGEIEGFHEECGNGMDDDGDDGLIDEGCPCGSGETQSCFSGTYPHRLIGRCLDGTQACDVSEAQEFGTWGACSGDATPLGEVCEGSADEDCDGAIDEGCPCSEGESRVCGSEFSIFPCRPGRQACSEAGVWSSCAGAIGPGPELCGDTLDNDCDGVLNEGCQCVAAPETCADGIDNDCDGEVDEPACAGTIPTCEPLRGDCLWTLQSSRRLILDLEHIVDENFHGYDYEVTTQGTGTWALLHLRSGPHYHPPSPRR